jgi:hypothetical protein
MGNRKEQQKKADKVAQAVSRECLPSKHEAPNSNLSTAKKKKKYVTHLPKPFSTLLVSSPIF